MALGSHSYMFSPLYSLLSHCYTLLYSYIWWTQLLHMLGIYHVSLSGLLQLPGSGCTACRVYNRDMIYFALFSAHVWVLCRCC
ncbi:hypothetical protein FKM82_030818 [Ascaphus truei]